MTKRIERDLFARLMRLSARERSDILEFLGQSPVSADDLVRSVERIDRRQPPPECGRRNDLRQLQS
jgi:hypothetical protein